MPLRLVLLSVAATLAAASGATAQPLTLASPRVHLGWVSLRVAGTPGVTVAVAEATAAGPEPVATVVLGTGGTAVLDRAARWRCDRRARRFTAAAGAFAAAVAVRTPSCRGRLALTLTPRRPRAGRGLAALVRDRWAIGDVAARLCAPACRELRLAAGASRLTHRVPAPRAGRVVVALRGPAGDVQRRARRVAPASGRLRVLATGDSMIQLLDGDLEARLRAAGPIWFRSEARIGSGLSKPFLFDWAALARRRARALRPDVSVVFLGANDGYGFRGAPCCGAAWVRAYAGRARAVMAAYARDGAASVFWILLPAPRSRAFRAIFTAVNRALRRAARAFPRTVHLVDLGPALTPGGRFRATLRRGGRTLTIRQRDGVHLSVEGARIAAGVVLGALRRQGLGGR